MCKDCKNEIMMNDRAAPCEYCRETICLLCLGYPEHVFDELKKVKMSRIKVVCRDCENSTSADGLAKVLKELQMAQQVTMTTLSQMDNKLRGMEDRIKESVKDTIKEEIDRQITGRIDDEMDNVHLKIDSEVDKMNVKMNNIEDMMENKISEVSESRFRE